MWCATGQCDAQCNGKAPGFETVHPARSFLCLIVHSALTRLAGLNTLHLIRDYNLMAWFFAQGERYGRPVAEKTSVTEGRQNALERKQFKEDE